MFLIHLNLNLEYSCINTKQIYFHKLFSNYFVKHNQIHKYPTRNAENYSIHKLDQLYEIH